MITLVTRPSGRTTQKREYQMFDPHALSPRKRLADPEVMNRFGGYAGRRSHPCNFDHTHTNKEPDLRPAADG